MPFHIEECAEQGLPCQTEANPRFADYIATRKGTLPAIERTRLEHSEIKSPLSLLVSGPLTEAGV